MEYEKDVLQKSNIPGRLRRSGGLILLYFRP
jgi:hypothetical protein